MPNQTPDDIINEIAFQVFHQSGKNYQEVAQVLWKSIENMQRHRFRRPSQEKIEAFKQLAHTLDNAVTFLLEASAFLKDGSKTADEKIEKLLGNVPIFVDGNIDIVNQFEALDPKLFKKVIEDFKSMKALARFDTISDNIFKDFNNIAGKMEKMKTLPGLKRDTMDNIEQLSKAMDIGCSKVTTKNKHR